MAVETLWFVIVVMMFAVYAVLDGFDFGTGIIYLFVARTDEERQLVLKAIGPVWKGNEVWLVAGGGLLFLAFPKVFAAGFSGFYLALNLVLWFLILRGLSIAVRSHLRNPLWRAFWDAIFAVFNLLLAVVFGAALGNIIRGVPLGPDGYFFAALWTTFTPGPIPGILDWFTVLVGVLAVAMLAVHGANYLAIKTDAAVQSRARRIADSGSWAVVLLAIMAVPALLFVQPALQDGYVAHPVGSVVPLTAGAALFAAQYFRRRRRDGAVFLSWSLFILGSLGSVAWGLFPNLLIATEDPAFSLTSSNSAASSYGLRVGLVWFSLGISLVIGYTLWVYVSFRGKVERVLFEGPYE
ncbi:MAG: Cytochrome bd oxidase, subunit II [Candidatus Nitrospira kreftii]|uniref:Cytochrome bd oxidase, subunit II n=1 Tax=Candidatus Nitrospira kreftii TaxID=2652173 RepID=A0A7S8FG42_9BACT|nr:MAG: Cytochrome bd oxidase, subunit II [Candidatus Nitrospira kreftii]